MKKIFFLLFTFSFLVSFSQGSKIDSLLSLIKKDKEDTNKVKHLNELAWNLKYSNTDSSISITKHALAIAEKIITHSKLHKSAKEIFLGKCLHQLGALYYFKDDFSNSLDCYFKAINSWNKISETNSNYAINKCKSATLGNIALVYDDQGDMTIRDSEQQIKYDSALKYYFMALKIDSIILKEKGNQVEDKSKIANDYSNIGIIYDDKADVFRQSGDTIQSNRIYQKSLDYYTKALKNYKELENQNQIKLLLSNIGGVYIDQRNYSKALEDFISALRIDERSENKSGIITSLNNIGSVYLLQNNFPEAEKTLLQADSMNKDTKTMKDKIQTETLLSKLYDKKGQPELALKYLKTAMAEEDTLYYIDNDKGISHDEINSEFDKQEEAAKGESDKQKAVEEATAKKQIIIIWLGTGGLLLVIIFSVFMYNRWRLTNKQKLIIEAQKSEVEKSKNIIEEKNKDITDSINYARRIQHAKLPKQEEIISAFPDSLILFKPKDIVSGDFYFYHKKDDTSFIAAVDCTGHGVPGAFMSLIGSDKLEEAVSKSSNTSEILSRLNMGVKIALKQSESDDSTRDGMDIALCSVDTKNRIINYAGANRPIWIIRKNKPEVEEIKATKKAIGGFTEDNQHFDSHEIQLQQGDTFYIFSDGYADTFSGENSKKLTTKKFKEILLRIQEKTMVEQKKHLDEFIESWKDNTEQVDDILVIGIRL